MAGPKDAAFRHYSGPVGKPTYELKLQPLGLCSTPFPRPFEGVLDAF